MADDSTLQHPQLLISEARRAGASLAGWPSAVCFVSSPSQRSSVCALVRQSSLCAYVCVSFWSRCICVALHGFRVSQHTRTSVTIPTISQSINQSINLSQSVSLCPLPGNHRLCVYSVLNCPCLFPREPSVIHRLLVRHFPRPFLPPNALPSACSVPSNNVSLPGSSPRPVVVLVLTIFLAFPPLASLLPRCWRCYYYCYCGTVLSFPACQTGTRDKCPKCRARIDRL